MILSHTENEHKLLCLTHHAVNMDFFSPDQSLTGMSEALSLVTVNVSFRLLMDCKHFPNIRYKRFYMKIYIVGFSPNHAKL